MNIQQALIARIQAGAGLSALLDTYEGSPAVFSRVTPPGYEWQEKPGVLVRLPSSLEDTSAFQSRQSDALVAVVVYGMVPQNSSSSKAVGDVAKLIRELFRGKAFTGPDGVAYTAVVFGPIAAPVETPQLTGELLQVRLTIGD